MIITVILILIVTAFICAILAAGGKIPLWVSVVLLCIIELLRALPVGK